MNEKQTVVGEAAWQTKLIAERLRNAVKAENYDPIPYEELSKLIEKDVPTIGRCYLESAKRIVERETGRLFGIVRKVGIKLLVPAEQVAVGTGVIDRFKRATSRAVQRIGRVQVDKLDDRQKIEYHATASVLGALHLFTRKRSVEKIEAAATQAMQKLDVDDTLKLFGK